MNCKKISLKTLSTLTLLCTLSSCSTLNPVLDKISSLFNKKVEKEVVLPQDREQVNKPQALPF